MLLAVYRTPAACETSCARCPHQGWGCSCHTRRRMKRFFGADVMQQQTITCWMWPEWMIDVSFSNNHTDEGAKIPPVHLAEARDSDARTSAGERDSRSIWSKRLHFVPSPHNRYDWKQGLLLLGKFTGWHCRSVRSWVNCCRSCDLSFYFMNFRVWKDGLELFWRGLGDEWPVVDEPLQLREDFGWEALMSFTLSAEERSLSCFLNGYTESCQAFQTHKMFGESLQLVGFRKKRKGCCRTSSDELKRKWISAVFWCCGAVKVY